MGRLVPETEPVRLFSLTKNGAKNGSDLAPTAAAGRKLTHTAANTEHYLTLKLPVVPACVYHFHWQGKLMTQRRQLQFWSNLITVSESAVKPLSGRFANDLFSVSFDVQSAILNFLLYHEEGRPLIACVPVNRQGKKNDNVFECAIDLLFKSANEGQQYAFLLPTPLSLVRPDCRAPGKY